MSVPEPVILCDPFYHSSNWFQEIIAGFRDAAAKDRNNSPIHIHSTGTIGQLRLEPGIPVIVTNSSLKNLTSAVQQLRQAGIPVILSGVDGAHFGSDICSVASDSALAMTQMVRYLLSYDRKRIALNKGKPFQSQLVPIISTMVNSADFKYSLETVRSMKYYAFITPVFNDSGKGLLQLTDTVGDTFAEASYTALVLGGGVWT